MLNDRQSILLPPRPLSHLSIIVHSDSNFIKKLSYICQKFYSLAFPVSENVYLIFFILTLCFIGSV